MARYLAPRTHTRERRSRGASQPSREGSTGRNDSCRGIGGAPMKTEKIFGGAGYDPQFDRARLKMQVERIRSYMLLAGWKTLREIKTDLERTYAPAMFPESSISAQLRNLKKLGYSLLKQRRAGIHGPGAGIWSYRLLPPELQLGLF